MKFNPKLLECLFGHHEYSDKVTRDTLGADRYLCRVCKRNGYWKWPDGHQRWTDYDKEGRPFYDKHSDGSEMWRDKDGEWVYKKPKNWRYER